MGGKQEVSTSTRISSLLRPMAEASAKASSLTPVSLPGVSSTPGALVRTQFLEGKMCPAPAWGARVPAGKQGTEPAFRTIPIPGL